MVLTSKAHRRRTPKISRRIPTIPTGCFDGWIVNVSAVDTGPRGSEFAGFLVEPGASVTGPPQAGLLHEGWDPLAKGCAYCTKVPLTCSTPAPPPVTPHPRAVHQMMPAATGVTGAAPLRQAEAQLSHLADAAKRCSAML